MKKEEKLFEQFPPVPASEWMDKIKADLKGVDFSKKMVWRSPDGLELMPFYRREDTDGLPYMENLPGEYPFIRGSRVNGNSWLVRQDIHVKDYGEAGRKATAILMKGIDSLGFIIEDPESITQENFELLLRDIHTECIELNFRSNGKAKELLHILTRVAERRGLGPEGIKGAIEADPLGRLMQNGTLCIPESAGFDYLASLTSDSTVFPGLRTIHLGASAFGNAGADLVQELAFAIAMGSEYLVQLTGRGLDPVFAASKIRFSFATGSSYFPEIAKLRAARLLWSAVLNRFAPGKGEELAMDIHCVTSRWNKTVFDPYVNMLRTQTEAMSAILGGAGSLTVEPFDIVFRDPDEFSERIARNQQLLLKEEAYFDKVADPGAGSYYIEKLTRLLAEEAWKLFVETEGRGGFLEALRSGSIQALIEERAVQRRKDVSGGKRAFVGTNRFPDPAEPLPARADLRKAAGPLNNDTEIRVRPLSPFRGAEEFEELRASVLASGKVPSVFLFTIGSPAMRKARAQFSAGFFGCAGYRITDNDGFSSVGEGMDAFARSGASILVICSSDEEYTVYVPEILARLERKDITPVIAGNPASAGELRAMGIEHFIHLRSDAVSVLRQFNQIAGITG